MGLSTQLSPNSLSPSGSGIDPSNIPPWGLLWDLSAVSQGPSPLTDGIPSGGEGSQSVDEVLVPMGDPLLIQDLCAGEGTGTNRAAI